MINEQVFRIKQNGEPNYKCYCRHPELIENYDKAIADTTQTWEVHHRLECCFTQKFLEEMSLYYDVEPEALIFLTHKEHCKIDSFRKRCSESRKGKMHSEEHKRKISEAQKGKFINRKDLSNAVLCVETGEIFESIREAQRKTGINHGNISAVCIGHRKTAGGYHWAFCIGA